MSNLYVVLALTFVQLALLVLANKSRRAWVTSLARVAMFPVAFVALVLFLSA